jgi:hypothetical protein
LDSIPRELEAHYNECRSRSKSPDKAFFIRQLLSAADNFSTVHIMLDALDECTSGTLDEIVELIHQFKDSRIKVFCTFRPIINLRDRLDVPDIHTISAQDSDIRNYLSIRLNKEWRHDKRFLGKVVDRLVEGAEGK